MLIDRIGGATAQPYRTTLPTTLIHRETIASPQ
jgi:DNA-binding LacI/PurR family transcriptional regulator